MGSTARDAGRPVGVAPSARRPIARPLRRIGDVRSTLRGLRGFLTGVGHRMPDTQEPEAAAEEVPPRGLGLEREAEGVPQGERVAEVDGRGAARGEPRARWLSTASPERGVHDASVPHCGMSFWRQKDIPHRPRGLFCSGSIGDVGCSKRPRPVCTRIVATPRVALGFSEARPQRGGRRRRRSARRRTKGRAGTHNGGSRPR